MACRQPLQSLAMLGTKGTRLSRLPARRYVPLIKLLLYIIYTFKLNVYEHIKDGKSENQQKKVKKNIFEYPVTIDIDKEEDVLTLAVMGVNQEKK